MGYSFRHCFGKIRLLKVYNSVTDFICHKT